VSRTAHLAAAVLIVLAAAGTAAGAHALGRASRHAGPAGLVAGGKATVVMVRSGRDTVALWRERGFSGRIVVHAGRFLHFVSPDEDGSLLASTLVRPGTGSEVCAAYAARSDWRNYLRVAIECGVARGIHYVLPRPDLAARATRLGRAWDGESGTTLDLGVEGVVRTASLEPPSFREPVLLDIHASFFDGGDGDALLGAIRRAGIRSDLVTLCLSDDSPDVSPEARHRLVSFARALGVEAADARGER